MMKSLSKSVIVSLVLILISLFVLANSVFALGNLGITNGNTVGNTLGNTLNNGGNTSTITPTGNTVGNTVQANITKINEIDSDKDLPQTGENDIYMISFIGLAAVVIGSVAYVKSKKYDM